MIPYVQRHDFIASYQPSKQTGVSMKDKECVQHITFPQYVVFVQKDWPDRGVLKSPAAGVWVLWIKAHLVWPRYRLRGGNIVMFFFFRGQFLRTLWKPVEKYRRLFAADTVTMTCWALQSRCNQRTQEFAESFSRRRKAVQTHVHTLDRRLWIQLQSVRQWFKSCCQLHDPLWTAFK